MQIHGPSATVGAIIARLNTVREPFAVIDLGGVTIHIESVADADELIKAAVKAKDLLLGETSEPVRRALDPERDDWGGDCCETSKTVTDLGEGITGQYWPPAIELPGRGI